MIEQFKSSSALLLIDVQKGVDVLEHWGGPHGRRNNPQAERHLRQLLEAWRQHALPVYYTVHDSRERHSPLKLSLPTGEIKAGLEPKAGEPVVRKDVNSGFIGTNLAVMLRRQRIDRLVIAGFFTNMCVETTVRMAGNLGFDTYLVADACAATNRTGPDGIDSAMRSSCTPWRWRACMASSAPRSRRRRLSPYSMAVTSGSPECKAMNEFGAHSMSAPASTRAAARAACGFRGCRSERLEAISAPIDLLRAREEHAALVALLHAAGIEVTMLEERATELADSVFTYDASLVTRAGAVLMRMGKDLRRAEPDLHASLYRMLDIPLLGRIEPPGRMEAGDALWVNEQTLILGLGYRTNEDGARQLARILAPLKVEVTTVDLPYGAGPQACLHLLSLLSLLAEDLALVYLPLTPVRLVQALEAHGIEIVPAPEAEYQATNGISANVLACAPRDLVMLAGFPQTQRALEERGCTVSTFRERSCA